MKLSKVFFLKKNFKKIIIIKYKINIFVVFLMLKIKLKMKLKSHLKIKFLLNQILINKNLIKNNNLQM